MSIRIILFLAVFFFVSSSYFPLPTQAQGKKGGEVCIAFYNIENLFDTIDDPATDDAEFTPAGSDKWDSQRYKQKLANLAKVIGQIGENSSETGAPVLVGLAEVENQQVVVDLINTPPLKNLGYKIVHYDSPDKRGIDVALIYQSKVFKVTESTPIPLKIEGKDDFFTRDILQVKGTLNGQTIYVFVNHWPSRSKGQSESAPLRNAAADLCHKSVSMVFAKEPNASIIVMGDLNDDPTDESVTQHLGASGDADQISSSGLFNPMWGLFKNGNGTLEYKGQWNLFDQIMLSKTLVVINRKGYFCSKAGVFKKDWMLEQEGKYKGSPFRTYAGSKYLGGYSDHLPVYIILKKT